MSYTINELVGTITQTPLEILQDTSPDSVTTPLRL